MIYQVFDSNYIFQIKTKRSLDREKQARHYFTIVAVDGGKPSLTSSTTISIDIKDVNDNTPVFIYPSSVRT